MMPAAVSVPGDPKGAPVNDSMAAPIEAWPPGAGVGSIPAYVQPLPAAVCDRGRLHRPCVNSQRVGQRLCGGSRIAFAREDVHDDVGGFKADGKAARSAAGMPGAGIERPVRFQHRDGREVEIALAVRTPLTHLLDHARRLPHRVPVNAIVAGHEEVGVETVARRRQDLDQEIDRRGVVGVLQHRGTDVGGEPQRARQGVDVAQHGEGIGPTEALACTPGMAASRCGSQPPHTLRP